eukprot:3559128-Amphidinium_carterae.1
MQWIAQFWETQNSLIKLSFSHLLAFPEFATRTCGCCGLRELQHERMCAQRTTADQKADVVAGTPSGHEYSLGIHPCQNYKGEADADLVEDLQPKDAFRFRSGCGSHDFERLDSTCGPLIKNCCSHENDEPTNFGMIFFNAAVTDRLYCFGCCWGILSWRQFCGLVR